MNYIHELYTYIHIYIYMCVCVIRNVLHEIWRKEVSLKLWKEWYLLSVLSGACATDYVTFLGVDVCNLEFGSFGKASSGPLALCSWHRPDKRGCLLRWSGKVFDLSLGGGAVGGGRSLLFCPGLWKCQASPGVRPGWTSSLGELAVSRVNTEKEGWAPRRPHCKRKAFSSRICLAPALVASGGWALPSLHRDMPSGRSMLASLLAAEEVVIGVGKRAWFV